MACTNAKKNCTLNGHVAQCNAGMVVKTNNLSILMMLVLELHLLAYRARCKANFVLPTSSPPMVHTSSFGILHWAESQSEFCKANFVCKADFGKLHSRGTPGVVPEQTIPDDNMKANDAVCASHDALNATQEPWTCAHTFAMLFV